MPNNGPFYVGGETGGGINALPLTLVEMAKEKALQKGIKINVYPNTRISKLIRTSFAKWHLEGVDGNAALHDTKLTIRSVMLGSRHLNIYLKE